MNNFSDIYRYKYCLTFIKNPTKHFLFPEYFPIFIISVIRNTILFKIS